MQRRRSLALLVAAIVVVVFGLKPQVGLSQEEVEEPVDTVDAASPDPERGDRPDAKVGLEQRVLSKMHQTNQLEMRAGQLAMEKGSRPEVRRYGERLFRDHREADEKVRAMAEQEDIELIQVPSKARKQQAKKAEKPGPKQMLQQLQRVEGQQFDRLFLKMMVRGHKKAIQMLDQAAAKLEDGSVRELVRTVLPILEQHLEMANHLQAGTV